MAGVELFIVFSVAAFYFPVVPGCVYPDFLVPDTELLQSHFKERWLISFTVSHSIGEFGAVVCLDTFNQIRKIFHHMFQEYG